MISRIKFDDFYEELIKHQNIIDVSFFVNDTCNLRCPHCYARNIGMLNGPVLSVSDEMIAFLRDAVKDGVKVISIVGKEPFLAPEKTLGILEDFNSSQYSSLIKGVVSNLHLMTEEIAERLAKINNLYIDVSLNGGVDIHDKIMGLPGALEKSINGVKVLQKAGFYNIFVSSMLHPENIDHFDNFMDFCVKNNLKKIVIFPYCGEDMDKKLTPKDYIAFIKKITSSGYLKVSGLEIIIKNDYLSPEINKVAIKNFINTDELLKDGNDVLYNELKVDGNTFYFNFLPFPTEFTRSLRINYDGSVVTCEDMMGDGDLNTKAIGHISEGYQGIKDKLKDSEKVKNFFKKHLNILKKQIK